MTTPAPSPPGAPAAVPVVDAVLRAARRLLGCEVVALNRVDASRVLTTRTDGALPGLSPGTSLDRSDVLCDRMLRGAPTATADAPNDPAYRDSPAVQALALRTYVGVPVLDPDGGLFGTLCGFDRRPLVVPERQVEVLRGLAAVLTPYTSALVDLDAVLRRDEGRWTVEGASDVSVSGAALAGLVDGVVLSPAADELAWLLGVVRGLEEAVRQRVEVEQAVGVLSERLQVSTLAAFHAWRSGTDATVVVQPPGVR